jgi:hypothetical protein
MLEHLFQILCCKGAKIAAQGVFFVQQRAIFAAQKRSCATRM